jgi:hypothetical protein
MALGVPLEENPKTPTDCLDFGDFSLRLSRISGDVDTPVHAGLTYCHVATAMDNSGNECDYSNQAQAVIPSP